MKHLTEIEKVLSLLCPVDIKIAKLVNKFILIVVEARKRLDRGENINVGNYVPELSDSLLNDSNSIDSTP